MTRRLPLVFACSGCSSAGQIANHLALELDRRGVAEMSCLAGIGAAKPHFLRKLHDRPVWVIDGCPIECCQGVFDQADEHVDRNIRLYELGVRKNTPLPTGAQWDALLKAVLRQTTSGESVKGRSARSYRSTPPNVATPPSSSKEDPS